MRYLAPIVSGVNCFRGCCGCGFCRVLRLLLLLFGVGSDDCVVFSVIVVVILCCSERFSSFDHLSIACQMILNVG